MWEAMTKHIRSSAKEILGSSRGGGSRIEGASWQNEEIKDKVKEKQEAYAAFTNSTIDEEKEVNEKKISKKVIVLAKNITYESLYHKLKTKECEKKVFTLIRIRARTTRGLGHVRCIKDENDEVLVEE